MQLLKNLSILVIFASQLMSVTAQKQATSAVTAQKQTTSANKTPAAIDALFADLPIDDAAGNSVLSKGESGEEKIKKNIFVTGALNKSVCYTGEPVLLTYRLYSALQSKSLIALRPTLNNFNSEERPLNNESPPQKKKEGKMYRVFTIWQVQMSPFQPGNLVIDPLVVNNEVSYTSDNKTYSYSGTVSSNQPGLTVLPLPEYHGPEGFSGAIGKFQMKAFVVSVRTAAEETDSLCMEIEGSGNLNDISTPAIKWPPGFEDFSAKEKWELHKNAFPPAGRKVVTIPFVAHKEGHFTIPSIRFSYFDPSLKAYQELQSGPIVLDILPALGGNKKPLPLLAPPAPVSRPDYTWILWLLVFPGISVLVFGLVRKRAQKLPSSSSGTSSGSRSGESPGEVPDKDVFDKDAFLDS